MNLIKLEHVRTTNWECAFRGMRNPLESWDKSDSNFGADTFLNQTNQAHTIENPDIGPNDYKLATKLIKAGSDHRKFIRQIGISFDLTMAWGLWKEYATYKVGSVENSTSMMHKLGSRLLTKDDFAFDMWDEANESLLEMVNFRIQHWRDMRDGEITENYKGETKDAWRAMIQCIPAAFLYKRTCTINYEVLRNMYNARKNHKQKEWPEFLNELIKQIPYSEFITDIAEDIPAETIFIDMDTIVDRQKKCTEPSMMEIACVFMGSLINEGYKLSENTLISNFTLSADLSFELIEDINKKFEVNAVREIANVLMHESKVELKERKITTISHVVFNRSTNHSSFQHAFNITIFGE